MMPGRRVARRTARRTSRRMSAAQAPPPAPPAAPAAAPAPSAPAQQDEMAEIQKLAQMKEQGILTEEEFAAKKKQILGI
jgi:Short C-terminal domain